MLSVLKCMGKYGGKCSGKIHELILFRKLYSTWTMTMRAENCSNDFSVVKVTMCVISSMVHRSDYPENIV